MFIPKGIGQHHQSSHNKAKVNFKGDITCIRKEFLLNSHTSSFSYILFISSFFLSFSFFPLSISVFPTPLIIKCESIIFHKIIVEDSITPLSGDVRD